MTHHLVYIVNNVVAHLKNVFRLKLPKNKDVLPELQNSVDVCIKRKSVPGIASTVLDLFIRILISATLFTCMVIKW